MNFRHKAFEVNHPTKAEKSWIYDEYYIGERDGVKRKNGRGENHWSSAKSIEWYHGQLVRDTMHGPGEYRWRWLGPEGAHSTYEGRFFCNRMHSYGTMSYPDGKVFTGLFHSNIRWGPGIESQACLKQDVGLWRGTQLVRLTWRPETNSIAPDFCTNSVYRTFVEPHRVVLSLRFRTIGKTNSAIELLKKCGSNPLSATEIWNKLYPKHCTDLASLLCDTEAFERNYHKGTIRLLEEVNNWPEMDEETSENSGDINVSSKSNNYYTWNNNKVMIHMMKHSFTHEKQRNDREINLKLILSGPRQQFKPAGSHELDCRTLLMASFLGNIQDVVHLINKQGVHPDVADSQGNTAVMYAACGDQPDVIHFLVEAGANVDNYNDSCCTPLAVALLRLACVQKNIPPIGMLQAFFSPSTVPAAQTSDERKVADWLIERSVAVQAVAFDKSPSKLSKIASDRKIKAVVTTKDMSSNGRKTIHKTSIKSPEICEIISYDTFADDNELYRNTNNEFITKVTDIYSGAAAINPIPYLFEVCDLAKYVDITDEEPKKVLDKTTKGIAARVIKDSVKPSKETMWPPDKDDASINSVEKEKGEKLAQNTLTISQLLTDGANPKLVRCPQPALFIAIVSECSNIIKQLVSFGANINEEYLSLFGYTPLDIAVSMALSNENHEVVRTVLECGGLPNHRLCYEKLTADPLTQENCGPTLLHAVLAKKPENEKQEQVQINLLELLLDNNCNPMTQYRGRSAIVIALTRNVNLLHVIVENATTDLNAVINDANQTLLVKFFSIPVFKGIGVTDRLPILTNLLLYGADPLLQCQNGDEHFPNLFVFTKKTLAELESTFSKPTSTSSPSKSDSKKAKEELKKTKKDQISTKSVGKFASDDVGDYKQAMDLVVECARLLHIRWLQAKLMKELVETIDKYKHRQWNMIIKEHNHKNAVRLWLTVHRCIEIWDIMKETKKKTYNDNRILKYLLYIVTYYNSKVKVLSSMKLTYKEKHSIELSIGLVLEERKVASTLTPNVPWKRPYVKPELTPTADSIKFNVCFDCALPFTEEKMECPSCKLVSFCSLECLKANVERVNCHPCSDYLKQKFVPSPSEIDILDNKITTN